MKRTRARLLMGPATRSFGTVDSAIKPERRKKIRIYDPVFVVVEGTDACGNRYRFTTIARNIGPGGLCAYTPQVMETGEKISVRIRFARAGSTPQEAPTVAASAVVIRVEKQFNDSYLFAASFLLYRFLYQ
ncbi:MAG: hypothetical protein QUT30_11235 [Acidobacteriota bacterium]|nr:hypothetical protein [Acidobacteriota bacterium]